jgi:hypothetical protein
VLGCRRVCGGVGFAAPVQAGPTLEKVKQAGGLTCGVPTGIPGFAQPDNQGKYAGFDVDICRAISAALFGEPDKVKYVPLTAQQRFTALQSGEVDILSNNTTWTLSRDTQLGFNFGPVVFYDGQGFMVPKKLNVKTAKELNGATICVQPEPRPNSTWPITSAATRWSSSRSSSRSSTKSTPRSSRPVRRDDRRRLGAGGAADRPRQQPRGLRRPPSAYRKSCWRRSCATATRSGTTSSTGSSMR